MTLRLSVVSEHGIRLAAHSSKVFGVHGGSIGRGSDNEWILPDPERYLSGKHARIDVRAGAYVLVDTSSNGTYVNGAPVPLGRNHEYRLQDGDMVRLGEYEVRVSIDPVQAPTEEREAHPLHRQAVLEPDDRTGAGPAFPAAGAVADGASVRSAVLPASMPVAHATAAPLPVDGDIDPGLAAFCRGAGVELRTIAGEARGAALLRAGQLLREALLGVMDLNQGGSEFRNRFHITTPPNEGPEPLLDFSHGLDVALRGLLTNTSTRAGSIEALRDNFKELKAQHAASLTATRAAFEEFLARVDPKELEERFARTAKRGAASAPDKSRYWELYSEMFAGLVQRPADGFPPLYLEAFGKAYQTQLRTLLPPRRSAFGAARNEPADAARGDAP